MKLMAKTWLRWTAWSLLAIIFAASCVVLANWQLDRRDQAVAKIQRMVQNYDRQAIAFSELSKLDLEQVTPFEWSPVELSGRYLTDKELLVRNRPIAGQPGFLQLVPFELSSGQIVIIERGWIPADSNLAPALEMTPSDTAKQITARLRLGELTPNRESPAGFATSIHLESLASLSGLELEQEFYLRLISETPGETQTPQPLGKPLLDEGNHLSYAVQWIMFALMGFFALFWAIMQEREYRRIEKDPTYVPKSARKKKITDGDIEDQLLDASSKK
jgi:cytochrome oxidase assembly protein ShyY1